MPCPFAAEVEAAARVAADPDLAAHHQRFFKAFPGGYGEGDHFLGLKVPQLRAIAGTHAKRVELPDVAALLASPWHELRFIGLVLLVKRAESALRRAGGEIQDADYAACVRLYLSKADAVNNWDLVDLSAPPLLGPRVQAGEREPLEAFMYSGHLWRERMAVLSTLYCVRRGNLAPALHLAEFFLPHKHDLMHKACGWLLREAGKKEETALSAFLDAHCKKMPRTMLRYALERLSPEQRAHYMKK